MFCKFCGSQVQNGEKFCPSCGSPMEKSQDTYNGAAPGGYQQTYNDAQYGGPQPMMGGGSYMTLPQRNIAVCVILSIVTCGIYNIVWFINLTNETNQLSGDPSATSGGMAFLFTLLTCGIYSLFWIYKRGEIIDSYYTMHGTPSSSNSVLYLILSIFGLGLISYCLMQNELNKISRGF